MADLAFDCIGATVDRYAVVPALSLVLRISETSGQRLEAGEIPLLLLFSGTVFTVVDGRMQVQQVPWSKEASYRLPVSVWREAIDAHFPNSAWIKMSRQTMADLQRFKSAHALPTWDLTLAELLARADADAPEQP